MHSCRVLLQGENPGEYILILCNAIGSPVDSKYIDVEPKYIAITNYHVIAASDEVVRLLLAHSCCTVPRGCLPAEREHHPFCLSMSTVDCVSSC